MNTKGLRPMGLSIVLVFFLLSGGFFLPYPVFILGGLIFKPWCWLLCVASIALGIIQGLLILIGGNIGSFLPIGLYVVILYYLFRPKTRQAFGY